MIISPRMKIWNNIKWDLISVISSQAGRQAGVGVVDNVEAGFGLFIS